MALAPDNRTLVTQEEYKAGLGARVTHTEAVHKTGDETISGVKTFSNSPIVPTPTTATQSANKAYVDSKATGGKSWLISTVNNTNASSFSPTVAVEPPSTLFTYIGTRVSDLVNVQNSGGFGSKWKNGGASTTSTTPWGVLFRASKTRYVELMVAPVNANASMRISVNGVEESAIPLTFPGFPLNVFSTVRIDLGPEPRPTGAVIKVNFSTNMLFGRVWVESTGNVAPVAETGKRIVFHGDSLMQGETQNTGDDLGSYVGYLDRYLKTNDIWNSGIRGSGANTTSGNGGNYQTRATTDVVNSAADVVVVGGFFNDRAAGRTPAQVAADLRQTVLNIQAMQNRPTIIVMGSPDPTGGSNATEWATFDNAISAAVNPLGVCYVSQSTGQIKWADGSVATTQGPWITTAITSWFLGSDGLHPTDIGHQYMAARAAEAISLILNKVEVSTKPTNLFVPAAASFTLTLPSAVVNNQMVLYEVRASAAITVTIPAAVKLTGSLTNTLAIASAKSGFIGLRYSVAAGAWYLITAVAEA